jgi:hypothetical protein
MKYFSNLPKLLKTDAKGNSIILTNLLARTSVVPSLLKNPLLFYQYDIQDGDTPEIVATKYYGDPYRFWIVLFSNQILDPQFEWPLNTNQFQDYLNSKYPSTNIYSTAYSYQKIITQVDNGTNTTTVNKIQIDEHEYDTLVLSTQTYTLPTGTVTVTIDKTVTSIYEYELQQNESKRTINLINSGYADQLEAEIKNLMV